MPRPLSELSDTELQSIASGAPPLEHFSDEQLGALAVHQGLMQDEEAATAITEKKQRDRAPVASAVAGAMSHVSPLPAIVTETLLTRGGRVGDIAAEALAPIAGAIAGAPGGIPGIVAGGASGGAAGNTLAQARQFFRGERDNFAKGELTASAIAGGIPLGGRLLKTPARVIATRAAQGAGIAVGSQAVGQAIDHGRLDFQSLALTGMLGGLFGAGAGAVESALTRKAVLKAIRGTPEFEQFKGTDAELVDAVRTKMNEGAPPPAAAPAERNVTGTAAPEAPAAPVKPLQELTNGELVQAAEATAPAPSAPAQVTPLPTAPNVAAVNVPAGGSPLPPFAQIPRLSATELALLQQQLNRARDAAATAPAKEGTLVAPEGPKGPRLRFGARPDGVVDIIDAIHDMGGVPKAPKGATGGEWNGHNEVFRGPARILLSKKVGGLDQYLQDLAASYPQFAHLEKDPDAFKATVLQALRDRTVAKSAAETEKSSQTFLTAALEGKGRAPTEPRAGDPVPTDELNVGTKSTVKGAEVTVTAVDPDTGAVTLQDGPRFGTQVLPAGTMFHPDAGSYQPVATPTADEAWPDFAPEPPAASPAPAAPDSAPNASPILESATVEQQAAEAEAARVRAKTQAQRDAITQQAAAPLTGDSSDVGQGALFNDGADLFSGPSAESMAAAPTAPSNPPRTSRGAAVLEAESVSRVNREILAEGKWPNGRKLTAADRRRLLATNERHAETLRQAAAVKKTPGAAGSMVNPPVNKPPEMMTLGEAMTALHLPSSPLSFQQVWLHAVGEAIKAGRPVNAAAIHIDPKLEAAALAEGYVQQGQTYARPAAPRASPGAAGSMGREGEAPPPPDSHFPPPDDPTFSQLPLQLPEMVQFFKQISGGQTPKIMEKIRILHGTALGVFRYQEGVLGSGRVELRADLFNLLGVRQKNQLLEEAVAWATTMKQANPEMNFAEAVKRRFHELVKAAEAKALTEDPRRALDTFAHEIGHFVDFLPHGTITRGNILGRLASLHHYLKGWIAESPAITAEAPNANERAKLRRQAEKELTASVKEIVETITREVPVYREIPITAEHITSILKTAQREEFPELYDWFSKLDRAEKVAVLRQAMKGIVDERAARLAAREQTGTKIVEETVTRRTGTEPTPEAIRARYDELLREEFKRRGLISQKEIRAELETVIAWWQGVPVIPEYYKSPKELYAEMFSILLNNPAALAKRAPTVWKSLFAYFDRKPEVKAAYDKVQSDIKSGAIYAQRVANLRDAFRADEESGLLKDIAGSRLDWRKIRDTMRLLFDRQHGPIEARALRRLGSPESARVLSALKDYLYRMTAVEGYTRELNQQVEGKLAAAGLRHDDLAEFMFHSRIAAGDRQQIANAQGWSPNTSAARLKEMAADLGAARYGALEAAQQANRAIYETRVVDLLARADVLTPELLGLIRDRTLYATFAKTREFNPLEHGTIEGLLASSYGKDVTAKIFRQIGYLGDIRSPYLAMTQKAFALINFAYKQMALKSVVDFMLEHEPNLIAAAEVKFNGKLWEPRIVDTAKVGTLITLVKGEVKAFYVPREIVETMQHGSPLEGMLVGLAHRVLAWPKALLTELNAGFWPVAFAKDLATLGLQLPGGHRALRHVPAAFGAARASFTGKANPLADAALRRLMVISRADPRGEHLGHPDEMTRLLLRMGQNPALWDAEAAKVSRVMRAWMWWKRQGTTLERTAKIAGMMHLDSEEFAGMPEWMKKRMVNELAGSPDFLERGRAAPIVELAGGPIFYNAWLQGMRSFKRAAEQNPKEFWTKFLAAFGLPALAFYAFEKGLLDFGMDKADAEDHRDQLRSIPERDKLRGFVVPLGWRDKAQGKVAYLVLPFPDQVRYLVAGLRKTAQTAGNDGAAKDLGAGSMVQFGGQDLPGQNPLISEGVKWWRYAALGQNPYDAFHAKPALDPDVFKAGGLTAAGDLAKQSLSNLGGGLVYKYRHAAPGETPTEAEEFLSLPVVSNVLGRWVRVSNAGLTEEANRATAPVQQHEAAMRLVGEEMARKRIAGEPWAPSEQKLIENDPYLAGYVPEKLGRVMKHATSPEMRAFEQATSPMQKAALLQQWEQREKERANRLKSP